MACANLDLSIEPPIFPISFRAQNQENMRFSIIDREDEEIRSLFIATQRCWMRRLELFETSKLSVSERENIKVARELLPLTHMLPNTEIYASKYYVLCDHNGLAQALASTAENKKDYFEIDMLVSAPWNIKTEEETQCLRKQNSGSAAVLGICQFAAKSGYEKVSLMSEESAKGFYKKIGFTEIVDPFDSVSYQLECRSIPKRIASAPLENIDQVRGG